MATTYIYSELQSKIQSILEGCSRINKIYAYPAKDIEGYPAAIYYPSDMENRFETTEDNFKQYGFKCWIIVNEGGTTVQEVFTSIMPNVMDEVLEEFSKNWSFDNINGHRVWGKVETGLWTVSEESAGVEVAAELDLTVKMLTSN